MDVLVDTRIYSGLTELGEFADRIAGFPSNPQDERNCDFGAPGKRYAGGYCHLHFRCIDSVGHARLDIAIDDDEGRHESATAKLGFSVIAADIHGFISRLQEIEKEQFGEAHLRMSI